MTPTQRTLKYLRDQGYECGMVERWVMIPKHPAGGIRKDLFGIIDLLAIKGHETIGVQSTGQAFAEHHKKLTEEMRGETIGWLDTGVRQLLLIGWRKVKKVRGKKAMVWRPRLREYRYLDGVLSWNDS